MTEIHLSVVAPVYNEESNLEPVLEGWNAVLDELGLPSEIVLTDDGSTDGTKGTLAEIAEKSPRLRVVTHEKNQGYGRALASAIEASLGEWVVTIDSDGQFDLNDFRPLFDLARRQGLDAVTGYRQKKKDSWIKVVADRALNLIVRALFDAPFRDSNCALKLVRGDLLRGIRLEASGYPSPTELTIKLVASGAKVGEVEVRHFERSQGQSKLPVVLTGIRFLRFLLYLRGKLRLYRQGILHSI